MDSETKIGTGGRGSHTVMKPPTPPKLSDYDLTNVRIERAENGVVVECNYKMKPEAEKKLKGKDGKGYVDWDLRNSTEKHVFNNIAEAAEFLEARLLGKDYAKHEKAETKNMKVSVRKV